MQQGYALCDELPCTVGFAQEVEKEREIGQGSSAQSGIGARSGGQSALGAPLYGDAVAGDLPADPMPSRDPAAYTGTWHNRYSGPIEIAEDDDGLTLTQGPTDDPDTYPLEHWDGDVFTYLPIGENATVRTAVTFTIGPDGIASAMTVENLDLQHQGTFTRDASIAT